MMQRSIAMIIGYSSSSHSDVIRVGQGRHQQTASTVVSHLCVVIAQTPGTVYNSTIIINRFIRGPSVLCFDTAMNNNI